MHKWFAYGFTIIFVSILIFLGLVAFTLPIVAVSLIDQIFSVKEYFNVLMTYVLYSLGISILFLLPINLASEALLKKLRLMKHLVFPAIWFIVLIIATMSWIFSRETFVTKMFSGYVLAGVAITLINVFWFWRQFTEWGILALMNFYRVFRERLAQKRQQAFRQSLGLTQSRTNSY